MKVYYSYYTPYTSYMFRAVMWPFSGKCITKDKYIEILHAVLNE